MTKALSVLCCLLPPVCPSAIMLLVSAQWDILRVKSALKNLLIQLSKAIGRYAPGYEYSGLPCFCIMAVTVFFHRGRGGGGVRSQFSGSS